MNPERMKALARARRQADAAAAIAAQRDRSAVAPGRTGAELNATVERLADQLGPRAARAFPGVDPDSVQALCGAIALLGPHDAEEAWLLFFLIAEYGEDLSPLDIREAVRVLGVEADIFLHGWLQRHHQRHTGSRTFLRALWEYEVSMRLKPAGQEMVRDILGLRHPCLAAGVPTRRATN